jgi:hypothetical protein
VLPLVQHQPTKGQVVVDGRDQATSAGREGGRAAPLATLGLVVDLEQPGLVIGPVAGRETVELVRRHAEAGVLHTERLDAETQAEGQQVAHGDWPVRGHGVVERPVEPLQDLAVGQLGQQPIYRLVQPELAFLDEN